MPLPKLCNSNFRQLSSKELVYEQLKNWIIDGKLLPGEKLLDMEIANLFSVSRTPVREAFLALAHNKLVNISPGKGTVVSDIDQKDIQKLYEALSMLHASVLELSFPKIDESILKKLEDINDQFLDETLDSLTTRKLDQSFHQIFFDLIDNNYLKTFKIQLDIHTQRAESLFFKLPQKREKSHSDHEKIIYFLRKKDLNKARECLIDNWNVNER